MRREKGVSVTEQDRIDQALDAVEGTRGVVDPESIPLGFQGNLNPNFDYLDVTLSKIAKNPDHELAPPPHESDIDIEIVQRILEEDAPEELTYQEIDQAIMLPLGSASSTSSNRTGANRSGSMTKAYRRIAVAEAIARCIFQGMSAKEIATHCKITLHALYMMLRSEIFRLVFRRVRDEIYKPIDSSITNENIAFVERLGQVAHRALTTLAEIADGQHRAGDKDDAMHVRNMVDAARTILDRHPETSVIKREATKQSHVTILDPESAKNLARALASVQFNDVIDAQFMLLPEPDIPDGIDDDSAPS